MGSLCDPEDPTTTICGKLFEKNVVFYENREIMENTKSGRELRMCWRMSVNVISFACTACTRFLTFFKRASHFYSHNATAYSIALYPYAQ